MVRFRSTRRGPTGSVEQEEAQRRLLEEIDAEVRMTAQWTGISRLDPRVRAALESVPRHEFVHASQEPLAYVNAPLPIGHGQTISQPYIVAAMTSLLEVGPEDVVLEVGTGSGYQAAVLSRLVRRVYSVERIAALAETAAARLARLGLDNVEVRTGDGAAGWPEQAPFDGIMVTAAARSVPPALVAQLKSGRRLLIPVGHSLGQDLEVVEKDAAGEVHVRTVLPVAFVPLTSDGGGA